MLVVVLNDWVTETKDTLWAVEQLDQFGEVGEQSGQAIDLIDDDHVDSARLNVEQSFCSAGLFMEPPENPPSS